MRHPRLVLAAHGSSDPQFADVVESIAEQVRRRRPDLDVRIGYLEHGPPSIEDAVDDACVVVPLLLASGYHVRIDVPKQARNAIVTTAVGPDPLLVEALADRLTEAGYDTTGSAEHDGTTPVVLAGAGSSDERALDDVRAMAGLLGDRLGVDVSAAFVSAGSPKVSDVPARIVASYLIAPGAFHDALLTVGAGVVSEPIGAHPVLAQVVLNRYDAQVPGRTAPA